MQGIERKDTNNVQRCLHHRRSGIVGENATHDKRSYGLSEEWQDMNLVYCQKCGRYAPEGFNLCPQCMKAAGAGETEINAAAELLDIANILNIGDAPTSQRTAIDSIINIKNRLEEQPHEENT